MLNTKKSLTKIVLTVVSLFLIGCEDTKYEPLSYEFELYPESLKKDENGYYHFKLDSGIVWNNKTSRTKFVANTNNPNIQKVGFASSHYWILGDDFGYVVSRGLTDDLVYVNYDTTYITQFSGFEVPLINKASYTKDGFAYSWMAVPFTMIGDTVYVMSRYLDEYEFVEYTEKIGVIME